MFDGSAEDLKQTSVTQPAIFLHSVILALSKEDGIFRDGCRPFVRRIFSISCK